MYRKIRKWKEKSLKLFLLVGALLLIVAPKVSAATVPFSLNSSGTSHIGWMFNGSSWDGQNGWNTTAGNGAGQGDHLGTDYYADDWNKGSGSDDCGEEVRAPISGSVVYRGMGYNADGVTQNGYGYQVIIQSDQDGNFAYRATHLQKDSLTGSGFVNRGDVIGRVGGHPNHDLVRGVDYWSGNSTGCHLHSVLYKNINSTTTYGQTAITRLRNWGAVIGPVSGGPNTTFATPFLNDANPPSGGGQSACATYNNNGVVLFSNEQCTGDTRQFTNEEFVNLPDRGFNDAAKSMYIQSGWSAKIWEHDNRQGASVCFNTTKWGMSADRYDGGKLIVENNQATISSIQIYRNSNCTEPQTSACATYNNNGVVLFSNEQCTGDTRQFTNEEFVNLPDRGFNDMTKSMFIQSGWSARIWEHSNREGASVCFNSTKWGMSVDRYDGGKLIVENGQATISSIRIFKNGTCYEPPVSPCATYNSAGVTFFSNADCNGNKVQFTTPVFRNLTDYAFNDAAKSMSVQGGWSARIWANINRGGATQCITGTKWDLKKDQYTNGAYIVTSAGVGTISSFELYNNANCTPPDTTLPTGTVTGPANNTFNKGPTIRLTANASDTGSGVKLVQFYGRAPQAWSANQWIFLGSDATAPYELDWNASGIQDGKVTITLRVTDNANNLTNYLGSASWKSFTVDKTAPTGRMTAPVKNANLTGTAALLKATASDNLSGVSKVEFYVWSPAPWSNQQWVYVGTDTAAAYQYSWNIRNLASTYVYATVIVYDKAGNSSGFIWDPNWTVFNIVH